jgi:myo-inositol-1(or 4)-monophosphatase
VNYTDILPLLHTCVDEISLAIVEHRGRGYSGQRPTQYHLDLAADAAGLRIFHAAGYRVVSEESGVTGEGEFTVVMDPIDGSTNCDRGIPFYACSLAVLRGGELVAGLVANLATGTRYSATRGGGAFRDGVPIAARKTTVMEEAIVSFSGLAQHHLGWAQVRAMGAASLECCLVADGSLDAYSVAQQSSLHPWDYLAGLLICHEAGAVAGDYHGEELITDVMEERHPVFAATQELLAEFFAAPSL